MSEETEETERRIEIVLGAITDAKMAILATGESHNVGSEGRAPAQSDRYRDAQANLHRARQERDRLFVELVGDAADVPVALAERFGLTGREATFIVEAARTGSDRMREWIFGEQGPPTAR
ncbi:hypothetical protein [Nocardia asteroides]|uniref:hypothetical protein n=1 Tax=Nocardia asteroides TaxID=1824 RepID=UPI0033D9573D